MRGDEISFGVSCSFSGWGSTTKACSAVGARAKRPIERRNRTAGLGQTHLAVSYLYRKKGSPSPFDDSGVFFSCLRLPAQMNCRSPLTKRFEAKRKRAGLLRPCWITCPVKDEAISERVSDAQRQDRPAQFQEGSESLHPPGLFGFRKCSQRRYPRPLRNSLHPCSQIQGRMCQAPR